MSADRLEIRIAGTGGQGLILGAKMLADALVGSGKHVAQSQTYEPTSRGGYCNSDLVVTPGDVDYPLATSLGYLVLLDKLAVPPSWPMLAPGALVIADNRLCPELPAGNCRAVQLPITRTAIDLGSERVGNMVALGVLAALGNIIDRATLENSVRAETPKSYLQLNLDALAAGYDLAGQAATA